MVDDAELLRRYIESGSEPAFTEFVRRHLALVYFTAVRGTVGDSALAEEVVQEVFSVAARRARRLIGHSAPVGWLHTTTRHVAARALRRERTRRHYEQQSALHAMITGEGELDWTRLRPVVDEALEDLKANEREAILVRFFEGRAFADLGQAWRTSEDAARMRVDRAMEKLRAALERRGIASVASALATALTAQAAIPAPAGMLATVSGAALAAAAAPGVVATFFTMTTGMKIIAGTAATAVVLATGTALVEHRRADTTELRLATVQRELEGIGAELARAEQRRSAAETAAAEAESDAGALLAAVKATKTEPGASRRNLPPAASLPTAPTNPAEQSLAALFPNGIVATLGDRTITVDDVRREISPLLPALDQSSSTPAEFRQRLYALQNSIIANLVTRQLDIREFHQPVAGEPPKHISAEMIDTAVADRVKEQFNNDQTAFLAHLNTQGVTIAQYRQAIEDDIAYAYMRSQQRKLPATNGGPIKVRTP